MKLLDTTFLIDLLRGKKETEKIFRGNELLLTTQINMYEVIRGLFLRNVSSARFVEVMELFETTRVLPLDDGAVLRSAEISAGLIKNGETVADADCLIAGIALSKGVTAIVTKDAADFSRIEGLSVETY